MLKIDSNFYEYWWISISLDIYLIINDIEWGSIVFAQKKVKFFNYISKKWLKQF